MPKNVEQFSEQLTAFIALLNPAATNPDAPFPSIQSIKQSWQEIAQEHAQQLRHHGWPLPLSIQEQMQDAALSFANFFLTQLKQNKRADDKTLTLLWNGFIEAHKIADRYVPLTKDYFARITALKPQIKKTFKKPPTSYIQQLPKLFVEGHNFSLYLTGVIEGKPVQPPPSPTKAGPPIRRSGSTNGLVTLSGSGPGSPIIAGLSPKHARPPFSRSTTLDPNMLTAQRTRTPPPSPTPPSPEAQWQEIKRSYNSIINKPPELRYKMQVLAMRHLITAFDAIYHMLQGESIDFAQIRMQWKKIYSLAQELVEYSPLAITILKEIYAKYLAAGETQLELKQQKKICFAPPAIYCLINQYRFLSGEELAYLNIPPFISILLQPVIAAIDTSDSNANPFAIKPPQQIRRLFTLIKEQLDGLMQMVTHLDIGAIGAAAPLDFQITEVWRKIVELNTYLNHYDLETQIIEIEQINLYWYQLVQYTKILVRDPSASITKSYPALTGIAKTSPLPPHREIDSQVLQANRAILLEFDNDNPLLSGVINALLVQQRYLNPQHYRCQHLNLLMFFFHLLKQPLPSPRFSMLSELSEYREANLAQLIKTTLILLQQKPVTKAEQELAKLPGNHLEFLITAINIITENRYAISSNYFDLEDIARIIIFLLQNNQTQTYNNLLKLYAENETIVTEADRALTKVKFIIAYLDMLLKSAHPGDYHCTMMLWKETLSLHETVQADGASIVSYSPKLDELRQQIIVIQRQAHLVAFARMINAFNGFFSRPPSNLDDFFKQIEEKWQRIVRFYNTLLDRYGLLPEQLASLQRIALQRVDFIIGHINQMLAVQGPIIDSLLNPLWGKLLQTHLIADEYAVPVTQYDSQVKELRSKIYAACSAQRLNAPPPNLTAELSTPYAAAYQSSKSLNCSQQHSFSPPQRPPFNRSQSVATLPLATTTTAPPPLLSRASETTLTRHLDPRQQFNPHQGLRHTPDLRHNMQKTTMDSLVTAFKQLQSKLYPHALETMALQSANRIATQATGFSMSHQEELEQADKDQDKHDQIMKPMEASQQEAERAHLALMAAIEALPPGITESEPITEKYIADQWRRIAAIAQQLNRHQPLALPTLAKVFNAYQQVATMHIALKMGKKTVSFPPPALTDIIPAYNQVAREIVATFVTKEEEIPAELIPLLPKHKLNPEPLVGHSPQNLALLHLIALLRELANNLVELDLLSHDKILPEIQQKMRTISQLNQELEGYGRVSPRNIHIQQLNLEWQLIAAHLTNLRTRYQILAFPSAPPRQFLGTEINIPRAKKTVTARAKAAVKPAPGRNNYHGPDALEDTSALGADVEQIDCNAYGLYFSLVTNNGKHYLCSLRRLAEITYHTEKKLQSTPMYFYGPHGSGTMISIATSITTNINNADPVRKLPQIIEALIDRENNHHFQNGQQLTLIAFFFYTLRQPRRMQQKPPLLEELTGDNTSILAELIKIFLAILYAEKRKQLTIDQQLVVQEEMQRDLLVVVEHIACRFSAQDISKICSNFAAIDYAHLIVFLLSKQKTKAATKIFLTLPSEHTAGVIGAIHTASIAHKNNELFYLFTLYDHLSDTEREQFWNRFSPEQRGCLYPLANKPFSFDGHTFSEIHKLLKYYHSIKYTAANLLYLYHEVLILILAAQPTITRDGQKTLSPEVLGIINKNGLEVLSKQLLFLIKTASIVYHSNHDSQPEFEKLSQQREWLHEPKVILPILFHQQRFNPIKTQPTLTPPKMIVYWRHANKLRLFLLKVVGNADAQLDDDDWYKTIKLRLSEQTEYFISDPANIEREELVFQLRDYLGKNYNEQDEKLRLLLERLDGKLYDTYNKGTRGTLTPMLSWPANKILPINRIRISHIYFSRRQEFAETEINTFLINMKEEITRKESVEHITYKSENSPYSIDLDLNAAENRWLAPIAERFFNRQDLERHLTLGMWVWITVNLILNDPEGTLTLAHLKKQHIITYILNDQKHPKHRKTIIQLLWEKFAHAFGDQRTNNFVAALEQLGVSVDKNPEQIAVKQLELICADPRYNKLMKINARDLAADADPTTNNIVRELIIAFSTTSFQQNLTDEQLTRILQQDGKYLVALYLNSCPLLTSKIIGEIVNYCPNLKYLHLENLGNSGFSDVCKIIGNYKITTLIYLHVIACPSLSRFSLEANPHLDWGFVNCPKLVTIHLRNNLPKSPRSPLSPSRLFKPNFITPLVLDGESSMDKYLIEDCSELVVTSEIPIALLLDQQTAATDPPFPQNITKLLYDALTKALTIYISKHPKLQRPSCSVVGVKNFTKQESAATGTRYYDTIGCYLNGQYTRWGFATYTEGSTTVSLALLKNAFSKAMGPNISTAIIQLISDGPEKVLNLQPVLFCPLNKTRTGNLPILRLPTNHVPRSPSTLSISSSPPDSATSSAPPSPDGSPDKDGSTETWEQVPLGDGSPPLPPSPPH